VTPACRKFDELESFFFSPVSLSLPNRDDPASLVQEIIEAAPRSIFSVSLQSRSPYHFFFFRFGISDPFYIGAFDGDVLFLMLV